MAVSVPESLFSQAGVPWLLAQVRGGLSQRRIQRAGKGTDKAVGKWCECQVPAGGRQQLYSMGFSRSGKEKGRNSISLGPKRSGVGITFITQRGKGAGRKAPTGTFLERYVIFLGDTPPRLEQCALALRPTCEFEARPGLPEVC
jgi:hypothetical protein